MAETRIPAPLDSDAEDVHWALSTSSALWSRGESTEALKWLRRAAENASDANADERALTLFKAAAELTAEAHGGDVEKPPPPPAPVGAGASSAAGGPPPMPQRSSGAGPPPRQSSPGGEPRKVPAPKPMAKRTLVSARQTPQGFADDAEPGTRARASEPGRGPNTMLSSPKAAATAGWRPPTTPSVPIATLSTRSQKGVVPKAGSLPSPGARIQAAQAALRAADGEVPGDFADRATFNPAGRDEISLDAIDPSASTDRAGSEIHLADTPPAGLALKASTPAHKSPVARGRMPSAPDRTPTPPPVIATESVRFDDLDEPTNVVGHIPSDDEIVDEATPDGDSLDATHTDSEDGSKGDDARPNNSARPTAWPGRSAMVSAVKVAVIRGDSGQVRIMAIGPGVPIPVGAASAILVPMGDADQDAIRTLLIGEPLRANGNAPKQTDKSTPSSGDGPPGQRNNKGK